MPRLYIASAMKKRLLALVLAVLSVFALLAGRLFYVQVFSGEKLQARALDQWTRDLPVTPRRGDIVDVNGNLLASCTTLYNVYLRAKNVSDPEGAAKALSEILSLDYDRVLKKAKTKSVSEVTLKRKATRAEVEKIIERGISGVYFSQDIQRVYPNNELLSQVLGFVSVDNVGQSGLEAYYDKYLKGTPGQSLTESDITGVELEGGTPMYIPPVDGLNVKLTVDATIQKITENVLQQAMIAYTPKAARAIVMNPKTGAVLAMANLPSFDLNRPPRDDIATLMAQSRNALVIDIYEPGSTFKILTAAADLEEYRKGNTNAFGPDHVFTNGANFRMIDGQRIKCWTHHGPGRHTNQNLQLAMNNSCNPIFVDIATSLGKDTFYKYIDAFGYGKATDIDFIGESTGMLIPKSQVKNCDLARIGFGQTIAVTPLQLIAATAAAVNGGNYMKPYLVSEITDGDGRLVQRYTPTPVRRVISDATSRQVAQILENDVTEGSGKNAFLPGYRVGGKTGTAQKYENGHIAQGKNIMSFVGFFPANDPEYICLLVVDEPAQSGYGSTIAAPYVKMIFEQIIAYKDL